MPMTREQHFRTTFRAQFTVQTGIAPADRRDVRALPRSQFPSYTIQLGTTTYDITPERSTPLAGSQEFTLFIAFTLPQHSLETMLAERSDYLAAIELFFTTGYAAPVVGTGENYRIQWIELLKIAETKADDLATRYTIEVAARYRFTTL